MNYSDSSYSYLVINPAQTYFSHLRYKNSFHPHTGRGQLEVMLEGGFYGDSNEQMRSSARTKGCDAICASLCSDNSQN